MDPSKLCFIKDIDEIKYNFTIKVRIIRSWIQYNLYKPGQMYSNEMVVMDEQSDKIQATCESKCFPKFKNTIKEGVVLYVMNPSLGKNNSSYKFGENNNKLNFNYDTKLSKCVDFTGSTHGFAFADYGSVQSNTLLQNKSYDLIGHVIMYSTMENVVDRKGNTKKKMRIEIQDDKGCQLEITLWDSFAEKMTEYVAGKRREGGVIVILQFALIKYWNGISLTDEQVKNVTLFEIEKILLCNGYSLKNFTYMPYPDDDSIASLNNRLIREELDYDIAHLREQCNQLIAALTDEQKSVFDNIITAVENNKGGVFFVYGYGGIGKTFLWKTLSATIRSKGEIVLNVASSGIASLLLTGGRTTHSRFLIPINLNEDSFCYIKPNSDVASLLKKTNLIIWDEAPMTHKHAFEALDRTLKDIITYDTSANSDIPFGGKVIVFGGDFRQILPVVPNGSRQDIVNASLSPSYIWPICKILTLTKNMRLSVGSQSSDMEDTIIFAKWLLDIGEGKVGGFNDGESIIDIPEDLLITNSFDPIGSLIEFVYPYILENYKIPDYFQERAILAPTHEVVQEINDRLLSLFPREEKMYLSSDSLSQSDFVHNQFDEILYSPDVLNGLILSGLPNHMLILKVGVPVMLLRNIDQKSGLCNGTRLQVTSLGNRVVEAVILTGSNIGNQIFIPRMSLTPSDKRIPFQFKRR